MGVELAQVFARFGTKVTILQRKNTILPNVELQLATRLTEILTKEGVEIITNAVVNRVEVVNGKKVVFYTQGDQLCQSLSKWSQCLLRETYLS